MKKITYNNKQYVLNDPQYPVEETVTDADMNEIKEVVNYNANESENVKDALINITTEKSSNINVQDASGQNGKIKLFGISKQETSVQGNNYFDINRANFQKGAIGTDGVTINYNSENYYTENYIELDKAKYYLYEEESNDYNKVCIYNSNKTQTRQISVRGTSKESPIEIDLADDEKYIRMHYYTENITNRKIMLSKDSAKDYEEFSPDSPSTKYPSEIENTTGDIDITECNKNLANLEIVSNQFNVTTEKINANTFKITRTANTSSSYGQVEMNLDANKTYTVFVKISGENTTGAYITLWKGYNGNGTYSGSFTNYKTIQTTQDLLIIGLYPNQSNNLSGLETTFEIMIIEGNNINEDFVPHEEQLITFPLAQGQKMYEGSETADDGIHHKRKQIVLDGTENWVLSGLTTNNQYILTVPDIKIIGENNKGNLISSHFKEITGVEGYNNNNINGISGWGSTQIRISLDISIINRNVAKFKNWLAEQKQAGTPVIVEYPLSEEEVEAYTEEQQTQRDQLQNAKTYKTVTNVFTENAELEMEYVADTKTYIDNKYNALAEQILNLAGGN